MKLTKIFITLAIAMGISNTTLADDIAAGKAKAASCAGCHGAVGISNNPSWPNLAGQQKAYLAKQMRDFRSGKRQDALMTPMAKPLTDKEIANLAAYYNSLK
jgi:cytochrome c553